MKKFNYKNLIFNLIELLIIVFIGKLLNFKIPMMLIIIATFTFTRQILGGAKHYKSIIRCMIWSILIMEALFWVTNLDFLVGLSLTIFAGITLSQKGDISVFEYNNDEEKRKYREMKKFIVECKDEKVIKNIEDTLKIFSENYKERYKINLFEVYEMYFIENLSFAKMRDRLDIYDNHKIIEALDMIFMCFNTYIIKKDKINK